MRESTRYYLPALAVGLVSFAIILGPSRVLGIGGSFDWPAGDLPQHVAGAYAYLDSKWSFPIFTIDTLNTPIGTNAIFTDSAPAAGLLAKIFHTITGVRFNYLGAWYFFSWMAQAFAGAFLARQVGARSPFVTTAAAFFSVLFPAFLFVNGNGQIPLGSQFIVIMALGMALSPLNYRKTSAAALWALLVGLAIWTHVYLFAMSFAIFAAALLDAVINKRTPPLRAALVFLSVFLFALGLAYVGGYFTTTTGGQSDGYGFYSSNLLTFFDPQYSSLWDRAGYKGPVGHYEGYTYLGIAGALMLVLALAVNPKGPLSFVSQRPALSASLAFMALYAISNKVWLGEILLAKTSFELDFPPFSIFRAGGRFMLPLGYLIFIASIAISLEWLRKRSVPLMAGTLCALIAVHLADTGLLRRIADRGVVAPKRELLVAAIEKAPKIKQLPEFGCVKDHAQIHLAYSIMWIAARAGQPLNTAYLARTAAPTTCSTEADLDPDALNIVIPSGQVVVGKDCYAVDGTALCGPVADKIARELKLPRFDGAPTCPMNANFSDENLPIWLSGVSVAEVFGRWSDGREARLACSLDPGRYSISLTVAGYASGPTQDISLTVNSSAPLEYQLALTHQVLSFPAEIDQTGRLLIDLDIKNPVSPASQGLSVDARQLGVAFSHIQIDRIAN